MRNGRKVQKRGQPFVLFLTTVVALIAASLPVSVPAATELSNNIKINSDGYKKQNGHWDLLDIPEEFKTNTIHAASLPTGKILLVAGSGNNQDKFNSYHNDGQISVLATAIFDPATNKLKKVSTPSDLFCSGHALLQSGSLLVAGGTSGYEVLKGKVTKPGGTMLIHNENPDDKARTFKKGTKFTGPTGKVYVSTQDIKVDPAEKMDHGNGNVMIMHSTAKVFVEAVAEDNSYVTNKTEQFTIQGLTGSDSNNIYGQGGPMTLDKQDFRGDNQAYEFDPVKEEYVKVGDMHESRWYPSLPVLNSGEVLAVSGLDATGKVTEATEYYHPDTKQWTRGPDHAFPTYPALFKTQNPDVLFFSGSSAGYGPADKGRDAGFWNIKDNSFKPVTGLRYTDTLETSGSVFLPPTKGSNDGSQSLRVMLAGGGGVGESVLVTARTDIIDLADPNPKYTPGPDLPDTLRYINLTVTPWDEVFGTGGTRNYRAKGNSYSYKSFSINPTTNQITPMADALVGRTYHSGSLLLKDGRILVFGGDPLYSDKDNTTPGKFEQRIDIFTPPQFFRGGRPDLQGTDNKQAKRGESLTYTSNNADTIKTARLIPPSSATHVTNIEQRSVAAVVSKNGGSVKIDLPANENTLPNGWYMLFVTNADGMPSYAKMVEIVK
jgi:hypothetical protein